MTEMMLGKQQLFSETAELLVDDIESLQEHILLEELFRATRPASQCEMIESHVEQKPDRFPTIAQILEVGLT